MTVYPTNDVAEKARIRVLDQDLEDLAKDRKRGYTHLTCPVCAEKIAPATYETTCERCENIVHDGCSESSTCDDAYRKIPAFTTVCETCREKAPHEENASAPTASFEVYSFEEKMSYLSKITTRKQGTVRASFHDLCELFGQPHAPFDGKVQAQWTIKFDPTDDRRSIVADIYDWKVSESVYEVEVWTVASSNDNGEVLLLIDGLIEELGAKD